MIDLLLSALLLAQTPAAPAPAPPQAPAFPALLAAQVEAHVLRTQLYTQTLSIERARLDAAIAASLPGWRMDWTAMRLVPTQEAQR